MWDAGALTHLKTALQEVGSYVICADTNGKDNLGKKKKKEAKSTERQAYGLTVLKASHKKIRQLKRNHEPEIHGNKLWTSSWLIMDFLEQQGLSKKPRVMEVGCGWGLAGIYCAKRHGASVVGIDADENVFPYLDLHAEVNGVKLERKVVTH